MNNIWYLHLLIRQEMIYKGGLVVSAGTSWLFDVLEEKTVADSFDKSYFFAVFTVRGRPGLPTNISVAEVANQTDMAVWFIADWSQEIVEILVILIGLRGRGWTSLDATKEVKVTEKVVIIALLRNFFKKKRWGARDKTLRKLIRGIIIC